MVVVFIMRHSTSNSCPCLSSNCLQELRQHTVRITLAQVVMVDTGKGTVSQALFDFALLVDKHVQREPEWITKCLAVFAANGLTEKHDQVDGLPPVSVLLLFFEKCQFCLLKSNFWRIGYQIPDLKHENRSTKFKMNKNHKRTADRTHREKIVRW